MVSVLSTNLQKLNKVRISGVINESVVDGPGIRTTIFFQGCHHACPGCHNPETWNVDGGKELLLNDLLATVDFNPLISGVTFSGGEPFLQAQFAALLGAVLKQNGLDIWIYTGYTWEYLLQHLSQPGFSELLHVTDVIVDGPFIVTLKDPQLNFKGSTNQRIIEVQPSLATGRIIEWTSREAELFLL